MDDGTVICSGSSVNEIKAKQEEDEDEFRSCCEDENELKEMEGFSRLDSEGTLNEHSVTMYFKGISVGTPGDSGLSGIGVVIEGSSGASPIRVQKKLDFYVEESVADYLALLDGLSVAIENHIKQLCAFTDSQVLYDQIARGEAIANPLLLALRQRILEQASNIESFVLKLVPTIDQLKALQLARVAVGVVSLSVEGAKATGYCSICCEEKLSSMVLTIRCSHTFCSHCIKTYVEEKVQSSKVPIRCPDPKCKYFIPASECESFLPVISYESLERILSESNILNSETINCPYPNCSVLLDPHACLSSRASLPMEPGNNCVECPVCQRFICVRCGVPWHSSVTCDEYQNSQLDVRDDSDRTFHSRAQGKRWKRCQQCHRMIEVTHGCYHVTCWCDHPNELLTFPTQQFEQWSWDSLESLHMTIDAYSEQERSQLALIHRFLAGGFSWSDHHPSQHSPPHCADSYVDAMKDLHQLPWLERFVSVISDTYYEDLTQ